MSATADDLRRKARTVFEAQHHGERVPHGAASERVVGEIPAGPANVLRLSWVSWGRYEDLVFRGFMVSPSDDRIPMAGHSVFVKPAQLPRLAVLIADALDQLEVTSTGLRVRR